MTCINTGRLKDAELLLQTLPLSQLYQDLQKLQKVTSDVIQPHVLSQLSRSLSLLQTKQQQLCTHLKTSATAYENMESSLSSKAKAISDHLQYQTYTMDHSMRWHTSFRKDKFIFIYSILYKPCIFKAYRLLNVQTLCIFPCFCPYEPKQGKFLFSADYLIQQSCGSTLRFPCSVSVNVHCGTDISVSEKFLHIFRCCTV